MHPSKYHTPKPASVAAANNTSKGIAVPAPVQRVIKYGYSGQFKREINNKEDLISACRERFPRFPPAFITDKVNTIDEQARSLTLGDIYLYFTREYKNAPPMVVKEETKDEILLPDKESDKANYAFTRRTRLMALIKHRRTKLRLNEFSQDSGKKKHAEDILKAYLLEHIVNSGAKCHLSEGTLIITINNSPCLDKCSKTLIAFKEESWKGKIIIHYANPHGSPEEFVKRRKEMQEAGIEMHSFNPLAYIDRSILNEDQLKNFKAIGDRRKRARVKWNEENSSDQSEASEEEEKASSSTISRNNRRKAAAAAAASDTEEQSETSENESASSSGTARSSTGNSSSSTRRRKKKHNKKKKKKARTASPEPEPVPVADAPEQGGIPEDENQFSSSSRTTRSSKITATAAVTFFDPDERKYSGRQPPGDRKKQSASSSSSSSRRQTRSQRRAADSDGED